MKIQTQSPISIVAYKHNGEFHRLWRKGSVLDVSENRYIIMNNKTLVQENNGKQWYTREPAICIFYKDKWFNVICMLKDTGIFYYCNIASPIVEDQQVLKYIDYDLDIKVFPSGEIKLLDKHEYIEHKKLYNYPQNLEDILLKELDELKELIAKKQDPFNIEFINKWKKTYEDNFKNKT